MLTSPGWCSAASLKSVTLKSVTLRPQGLRQTPRAIYLNSWILPAPRLLRFLGLRGRAAAPASPARGRHGRAAPAGKWPFSVAEGHKLPTFRA